MSEIKRLLNIVGSGAYLSEDESAFIFDNMMAGELTPSQMGGLLLALRVRGETIDELTGGVRIMRERCTKGVRRVHEWCASGARIMCERCVNGARMVHER